MRMGCTPEYTVHGQTTGRDAEGGERLPELPGGATHPGRNFGPWTGFSIFDQLLRQECDEKFHTCSLSGVGKRPSWSVAGLFAGIGGIELGLQPRWHAHRAPLRIVGASSPGTRKPILERKGRCRCSRSVLATSGRSSNGRVPLHRFVTGRPNPRNYWPSVGPRREVFRLLHGRRVPWVLLENVRNMLVLDGGTAIRFLIDELEQLGYQWAYRLVDSSFHRSASASSACHLGRDNRG